MEVSSIDRYDTVIPSFLFGAHVKATRDRIALSDSVDVTGKGSAEGQYHRMPLVSKGECRR
jgi:hypothetical protein